MTICVFKFSCHPKSCGNLGYKYILFSCRYDNHPGGILHHVLLFKSREVWWTFIYQKLTTKLETRINSSFIASRWSGTSCPLDTARHAWCERTLSCYLLFYFLMVSQIGFTSKSIFYLSYAKNVNKIPSVSILFTISYIRHLKKQSWVILLLYLNNLISQKNWTTYYKK